MEQLYEIIESATKESLKAINRAENDVGIGWREGFMLSFKGEPFTKRAMVTAFRDEMIIRGNAEGTIEHFADWTFNWWKKKNQIKKVTVRT